MSRHINLLDLGLEPDTSLDPSNPSDSTAPTVCIYWAPSPCCSPSPRCQSQPAEPSPDTCKGPGLLPAPQIACHPACPCFVFPSDSKQLIFAGVRCLQPSLAAQLPITTLFKQPKVSASPPVSLLHIERHACSSSQASAVLGIPTLLTSLRPVTVLWALKSLANTPYPRRFKIHRTFLLYPSFLSSSDLRTHCTLLSNSHPVFPGHLWCSGC